METILDAQIEGGRIRFQFLPLMLRIQARGQKEQWQAYLNICGKNRIKKGTFHKGGEFFSIN